MMQFMRLERKKHFWEYKSFHTECKNNLLWFLSCLDILFYKHLFLICTEQLNRFSTLRIFFKNNCCSWSGFSSLWPQACLSLRKQWLSGYLLQLTPATKRLSLESFFYRKWKMWEWEISAVASHLLRQGCLRSLFWKGCYASSTFYIL